MPRKPIISGNWKMHNNHFEAIQLVQKLGYVITEDDVEVVDVTVHPPFTDLRSVQTVIDADRLPLVVGAQHCHHEESGAFTGEVSPGMLAKLDVEGRGFLMFLEQHGILDADQRELVLDRAMALDQDDLDLDDLKWVVLMVLFNQPGSEAAYAWMETQMFEDEPEPIH